MKPLALFIAGTNGSGKSSLRDTMEKFHNLVLIDPDKLTKENNGNNALGGRKAIELFKECISNKVFFSMETTLAGKSVLKRIEEAKKANFYVEMIYVGLNSVDLNIQRVADRVKRGGHDIPTDAIIKRYKSSRDNLIKSLFLLDELKIYDNTEKIQLDLTIKNNNIVHLNPNANKWVLDLKDSIERHCFFQDSIDDIKSKSDTFNEIMFSSCKKDTEDEKKTNIRRNK